MGKFSIGLLLSVIAVLFLGVFLVKFILKALFFGLAALLLVGFVVVLVKRLYGAYLRT
jgi:membrane protein required for beta-lactamase induction